MSNYKKPHLTFDEQLNQLKARGMIVTDDDAAKSYLRRLGYYRLSAYWYPFRKFILSKNPTTGAIEVCRLDDFIDDISFESIVDLYVFDKKLRLLVVDAVERIEVAVRVSIAYLLGAQDKFAQQNPVLMHGNFAKKVNAKTGKTAHTEWLEKHDETIGRSKEDFVRHYRQKYGLPLPIWVAIETWEFGMLSRFFEGMTVADKTTIAAQYNIPDWRLMESWLRTINHVRNIASHHSRLWNKNLADQPKLPVAGVMPSFDPLTAVHDPTSRVYCTLCIIAHLLDSICPNSQWRLRVKELMNNFPKVPKASVSDMGAPTGWQSHHFWR